MKILTIIDRYRIEMGLTRRQLADRAGVSIKRINDSSKITVRDLYNILKILELNSLAFWDEFKPDKLRKYIVIDFQGYVKWTKRSDGTYAVDPQFVNEFNTIFFNNMEVSR